MRSLTLSWSSAARCWKSGIISSMTMEGGIALINLARLFAACRRTIGVSSCTSWPYCWRRASCEGGVARVYGVWYKPVAEILEVNQSAFDKRRTSGMKASSICCCDNSSQILLRDSTA